jgi:2-polyprenyl-3-methyl-5-hydroxy-6-metoxy-1,4-benzoquinol methylase
MKVSEEKIWEFYQIEQRAAYLRPDVLERQESLVRLIMKKAPKKGKLLEIGFANGYLLKLLRNRYDCCGIDISIKNIEVTREEFRQDHIDNVEFIATDITEHDFNKKFDIVVACHVLEHFDDHSLANLLYNIYTILNHNGVLVGSVPYKQDLQSCKRICPNCAHVFDPDGHRQSFDENNLTIFLENAGFKNIYTDTYVVGLKKDIKNLLRRIYYLYFQGGALQFMATRC